MASSTEPAQSDPKRELAAIMFSDIAGYTAMMGRDEQLAMRALDAHRGTLRSILPKYNGRLIGEIGDGTLSSFHSAIDAVNCAREVQSLAMHDPELRLRIGIHLGDVVFTNNTVIGDGVNVASRLHGLAQPGGICISAGIYDEVRNKPGISARSLGLQRLKNVSRPIAVYLLTTDQASATEPASDPRAPIFGPRGPLRLGRIALVAIAATLISVAVGNLIQHWKASTSPSQTTQLEHPIRSIAVLPLDNFSGDPNQEYFADGMTDELTTDLASISALKVISRSSVMQFKGEHRPPMPQIAKVLNVDAVVEGSVLRSGDRVRITAQLIDAPNDRHLWAKTFERNSRDVLALQDDLATAIAREINIELTPQEQSRLSGTRSVNPVAYEAYLKGRFFSNGWTEGGAKKALDQYNLAIKADPSFAPAYSGVADAYIVMADMVLAPNEAMPKGRAAAQKSLDLAESAEARTSLAQIKILYDYDPAGAEQEFLRAIELNPNYAYAHDQHCMALALRGRLEEAIEECKRAAELDPLQPSITFDTTVALAWQGKYDSAVEQARKAIELDPTGYFASFNLGWVFIQARRYPEAIAELQRTRSLGAPPFFWGYLGDAYAASGDRDKANAILTELKDASLKRYVSPNSQATVYAGLGDKPHTLEWLEKAYQARSFQLLFIKRDHIFDALRSEPQFIALVKKLGLDQ